MYVTGWMEGRRTIASYKVKRPDRLVLVHSGSSSDNCRSGDSQPVAAAKCKSKCLHVAHFHIRPQTRHRPTSTDINRHPRRSMIIPTSASLYLIKSLRQTLNIPYILYCASIAAYSACKYPSRRKQPLVPGLISLVPLQIEYLELVRPLCSAETVSLHSLV